MENKFYIITPEGLKRVVVIKQFKVSGRVFMLHHSTNEFEAGMYAVSDFITGCRVGEAHKTQKAVIEDLNDRVARNPKFDYSRYVSVNSDSFQIGYNALADFVNANNDDKDVRDGVLQACFEFGLIRKKHIKNGQ